jgi:hypothetical protein
MAIGGYKSVIGQYNNVQQLTNSHIGQQIMKVGSYATILETICIRMLFLA